MDNNKDIIQSYIITTAKYNYNTFEKRIMYKIIEYSQQFINTPIINTNFEDLEISFPLTSIMQGYTNYRSLQEALMSLATKGIEYLENPGSKNETWRFDQLIISPEIEKGNGIVKFKVSKKIWKPILDFSKGWRKYELNKAMSFSSVYSMRLYELLSRQKDDKIYTINQIKDLFDLYIYEYDLFGKKKKVGDKYTRPSDLIKRVIEPSQKELKEKADYYFEYKALKEGKKIVKILFSPKRQADKRDPDLELKELEKQLSIIFYLDHVTIHYLKNVFGFSRDEIKNNAKLFQAAEKQIPDFTLWLSKKRNYILADTVSNPKGYLVKIIKNELNNLNKK